MLVKRGPPRHFRNATNKCNSFLYTCELDESYMEMDLSRYTTLRIQKNSILFAFDFFDFFKFTNNTQETRERNQ